MKLIPVKDWVLVDPNLKAVDESNKSIAKFKFGAIICDKRGRIVASGYNNPKKGSRRFGSKIFKTLHAEGAALKQAFNMGIDVTGMDMLIFRRGNNLSLPCESCQILIKRAGIRNVFYSTK